MWYIDNHITCDKLGGRDPFYFNLEMEQDYERMTEARERGDEKEAKRLYEKHKRKDKERAKKFAMTYLDEADLEELLQLKKAGKDYQAF